MDKNIDLKRRKPRQLRGTPSNRFSLYVACGIITFGLLTGVGIYKSNFGHFINEKIDQGYLGMTEEEIEKRIAMAPQGLKPSKQLTEQLAKLKEAKST